jgi:hypothetical protein
MTLKEAVAVFSRDLPITMPMLRTEIRKGGLPAVRVAGKFYVTPQQLRDLFKPCPVDQKDRGSISAGGASTAAAAARFQTSGSSEMERLKLAQATTLAACELLSNSSRSTSRRSLSHRAPGTSTPAVTPRRLV